MITLGINAAYHDSAAALVVDGRVVAAAEEERFTRIKHAKRPVPFSAWELPYHAIDFCLATAGVTLAEVDHVGYSFEPQRFIAGRLAGATIALPLEPSERPDPAWENPWDPLFAAYVLNAPRQLADGAPHHLRHRFAGASPRGGPYRFHWLDHHLCHHASAFLAAPFERCAVLTLDGRGERATTTYGVWCDGHYAPIGEVCMPHSLGLLYERVTNHLGFLTSADEYKVMALAAQGEPRLATRLAHHVRVGSEGRYEIDPIDLDTLAGPARARGAPLEARHFDLAASLQQVLETTALELARWLREASGERQLAMAGGVALNCVMNSALRDSGLFDSVWVQPAAGDAGTALGAALWVDARERAEPGTAGMPLQGGPVPLTRGGWRMDSALLGPAWNDAEIERHLRWAGLPYRRLAEPAAETARLLAQGRIVGWFQHRMEYGPRALGARSILASPLDRSMQARLNELKDREDFRPVAPAVPEERLGDWFVPAAVNEGRSPFMLFVYDVRPESALRIPAVCHRDGTARVQTVRAGDPTGLHALLHAFGALTGVPVLVNTSFNVRGEPIVCTPQDALHAFCSTPVDALVMGSCLLEKRP